ncbi:helix-turn-helix domain-containing protein [Salmonella enterica subsp. enterica serovar Typhimurium]|nr:helix-turn-helix domain-containing protein [Salmonella enterica subsp. enterica serovar Typhimurium]
MIRSMTVADIISYIEENLENKINIDTLCRFSGYGRRYIQIIFKKHINMPLWQYIKYRRITRASLLLRLTSSKIIDISLRLQFDSQQSFNREFKKIVGCTPLQYKNNKNWDLRPILLPRTVDFKHPTPPEICFIEEGAIYGTEISYEQEQTDTDKPFPMRWRMIDKYIQQSNTPIYLVSQFYIGKKNHESIEVKTIIGTNTPPESSYLNKCKYNAGMYARMSCIGSKEKYINSVNQLYLVTLPYYQLKRKEGHDIEIISKDGDNYKCELLVPVVV